MSLNETIWILLAASLVGVVAQLVVRYTYRRYANLPASSGWSAGRLAQALMDQVGLRHVRVVRTGNVLDDRYDHARAKLYLSDPTATSLAALAVAAHEVAHALQHEQRHWSLGLRRWAHRAGLGGTLGVLGALAAGWLLQDVEVIHWAAWGYLGVIGALSLTLPVEWHANRQAFRLLRAVGALRYRRERRAARAVLLAALLTYVGAALIPFSYGFFALWARRQDGLGVRLGNPVTLVPVDKEGKNPYPQNYDRMDLLGGGALCVLPRLR